MSVSPTEYFFNENGAAGLVRTPNEPPVDLRTGPDGRGVLFGAQFMERLLTEHGPDGHKASACVVVDLGHLVRARAVDTDVVFDGQVCGEQCVGEGCGQGHVYGVIAAGQNRDFFWLGMSDQPGRIRHPLPETVSIAYLGLCRLGFPSNTDHISTGFIGAYGTPTGPIDSEHITCNMMRHSIGLTSVRPEGCAQSQNKMPTDTRPHKPPQNQ